ncbi:hypothetical protein [Conexibacter woesei]|uniref:Secreted protein n=1 Tax=Conexibacter woesei (strain DSM 14684 / CCUG 47730 / CIP 108061 / JCM 11494 / NBRC 100937 / ID131577) TaxID=469383 RepID=D3F5C5_CONWI|nr:hypothetical protein [Conexibacter woesei]ADB50592.1 hypothetical protein Cwoe_2167 [Conexibacter woesei DSM 14684]
MPHSPLRALRSAALAVATVAVLGAVTAPSAVAARPSHPVLPTCAGRAAVKPSRFVIACADGNFALTGLRWSRWNATEGVAKGTSVVNTCDPNCAGGRFTRSRVTVRVWRLRACPTLQREIFTRMTVGTPEADGEPLTLSCPRGD